MFTSGVSIGEKFKEFESAYRTSAHLGYPRSQIIQQALLLCQEENNGKYYGGKVTKDYEEGGDF